MPARQHPPRSWGWHPLSTEWAERIVALSSVRCGDLVVDLGAGGGAITVALLRVGARVIAVELHAGRAAGLRRRFGRDVRVLEIDNFAFRPPREPFHVVANPPFDRSTHLVHELLKYDRLLTADLVLQRGVARRFVERPPTGAQKRRYSLGETLMLPRSAFERRPNVDTSVLTIRRR